MAEDRNGWCCSLPCVSDSTQSEYVRFGFRMLDYSAVCDTAVMTVSPQRGESQDTCDTTIRQLAHHPPPTEGHCKRKEWLAKKTKMQQQNMFNFGYLLILVLYI